MYTWKVEDLSLIKHGEFTENDDFIKNISLKDKIEFLDKMEDGKCSYFLKLLNKLESEKSNLKTTKKGTINLASLKSWIRKNDTEHLLFNQCTQKGKNLFFWFLDSRYTLNTNSESKKDYNFYEKFIKRGFYDELYRLREKEKEYYLENDTYEKSKLELRRWYDKYNVDFHTKIKFDILSSDIFVYDEKTFEYRKISLDEINKMIAKFITLDYYSKDLKF